MSTLSKRPHEDPARGRRGASVPAPDSPFGEAGIAAARRRGRGASTNDGGRFEPLKRVDTDDGWEVLDDLAPFARQVIDERARHIITRNASPDISFEQSINPYQGCEHGCAYCFARPTHAYWGLSPGLDFETRLFAKTNAAELLEKELAAPGYKPKIIAIGTNTDPYQPIERQRRIMRRVLEVLEAHSHPVAVLTKSALIARDLDILSRMAGKGLAKAALSVTTLDHRLSRAMEPRDAAPQWRIETISLLAAAGIPTAVMVAPVIPALNDGEIEKILMSAAAAGAREAGYILLRLPLEVSALFRQWLHEKMPERAGHVMSLLQDMRGGKDYDSSWGQRMRGQGPYAWMLGRRFELAAKRFGLNSKKVVLRTDLFACPRRGGEQLTLFA